MNNSSSGIGILGWIIIGLILLGVAGIGPCSSSCSRYGPTLKQTQTK